MQSTDNTRVVTGETGLMALRPVGAGDVGYVARSQYGVAMGVVRKVEWCDRGEQPAMLMVQVEVGEGELRWSWAPHVWVREGNVPEPVARVQWVRSVFRLVELPGGGWRVEWQPDPVAEASTITGTSRADVVRAAWARWGHFNFADEAFGEIFPRA